MGEQQASVASSKHHSGPSYSYTVLSPVDRQHGLHGHAPEERGLLVQYTRAVLRAGGSSRSSRFGRFYGMQEGGLEHCSPDTFATDLPPTTYKLDTFCHDILCGFNEPGDVGIVENFRAGPIG